MRTLIVDNYDSFTHNLVHLLAETNQEEPLVVKNDVDWREISGLRYDNIVISPGPGRPDRAEDFGISGRLIEASSVPLLGVCLGHQGIATLNGGSVIQAPHPMHGRSSSIRHDGRDLFQGIPSPFSVARYHSLIVERPLPGVLLETAATEDGLVMGLAHRRRPQWGLQFHPESILGSFGSKIIANFRDITRRLSPSRPVYAITSVAETSVASDRGSTADGPPGLSAIWEELPRAVDVEAAFLSFFAKNSTAFWLDSSLVEAGRSRWSYIGYSSGANSSLIEYRTVGPLLSIRNMHGRHVTSERISDFLKRSFAGAPRNAPPCPFVGGYVGWFGYEFRNECGSPTNREAVTPDALFIDVDRFIAVDHLNNRTYVVAISGQTESPSSKAWVANASFALEQLQSTARTPLGPSRPLSFQFVRDREAYLADIAQCLEWIRQGEAYQICLTNEIICNAPVDPLQLYLTLRRTDPAPSAAYLRWPGGAVLSASPESFLKLSPNGEIETRPIKGTAPRSKDPALDKTSARELERSEKDRAENLMIVDLLRNDLSRVCIPGSVIVPEFCKVETYSTLHTLVSTVRGHLRSGLTILDIVHAAFPGGSMTGVPKHRTLQLIDRLEQRPRGVYSGVLGWLGHDGAADLSIVIRTIVAVGGSFRIGVGGGVVAQSTPEGEYDEMLLKAQAALRAIGQARQMEPRRERTHVG